MRAVAGGIHQPHPYVTRRMARRSTRLNRWRGHMDRLPT
jgi:hypothetical protein